MNGIIFCDMPWTLESGSNWEHLQQAHQRLLADQRKPLRASVCAGYRCLPPHSLPRELGGGMFGAYHGVTGNLSLGSQGQINRTLRCAKFSRGLPVLLEPAVASEPPDSNACQ